MMEGMNEKNHLRFYLDADIKQMIMS